MSKKIFNTKNGCIILVFVFFLCFVAEMITGKISENIALIILHLSTKKDVIYEDMRILVPPRYIRVLDDDSLFLKHFSDPGSTIYIQKKEMWANKEKAFNIFKKINEGNFETFIQMERIVDEETSYLLSNCKVSPPDNMCDIFIVIPSKKFMIHYTGFGEKINEFNEITGSIEFLLPVK